jgi:hypothetical protein
MCGKKSVIQAAAVVVVVCDMVERSASSKRGRAHDGVFVKGRIKAIGVYKLGAPISEITHYAGGSDVELGLTQSGEFSGFRGVIVKGLMPIIQASTPWFQMRAMRRIDQPVPWLWAGRRMFCWWR